MNKLKYLLGLGIIIAGLTACQEQSDTQSDIQVSEDLQTTKHDIEIEYPRPDSSSNQPVFYNGYINSDGKLEIFARDVLSNKEVIFTRYVLQEENKWEKIICDWSSKIPFKEDELITNIKVNCDAKKIFFNVSSRTEENDGGIFVWDEEKMKYSKMDLQDVDEEHASESEQPIVIDSKGNNVLIQISENYSVVIDLRTNTVLAEFDFDTSFACIGEDSLFAYRGGELKEYSLSYGTEKSYALEEQRTQDIKACIAEEGVYLLSEKGIYLWKYGDVQVDKKISAAETEMLGGEDIYIYQILVDQDSNIYYILMDRKNVSAGNKIYKISAE